jgi:3-methyl-2-oxobutanoate hydroxymethyltransferase
MHHPHHAKHVPSFCKQYANLGASIHDALIQYKEEVHNGSFPTTQYSPYKMSDEEIRKFDQLLEKDAEDREQASKVIDKKKREEDEYEIVKLY